MHQMAEHTRKKIAHAYIIAFGATIAAALCCPGSIAARTQIFTDQGIQKRIKITRQNITSIRKQYGNRIIHQIRIHGLKKTKPEILLTKCLLKPGEKFSKFNPALAQKTIKDLKLFYDPQFFLLIVEEKQKEKLILEIVLKEKITLIPFPFFFGNTDSQRYGLFILETNFLGLGKTFYGGLIHQLNHGTSLTLGFVDPNILQGKWRALFFLSAGRKKFQNGDIQENIIEEFKADYALSETGIGYNITPSFALILSNRFLYNAIREYDFTLTPEKKKQLWHQIGLRLRYRFLSYDHALPRGIIASGLCGAPIKYLQRQNNVFLRCESKIKYHMPLGHWTRLNLALTGAFGDQPKALEKRIGGKTGFRGLPLDMINSDNFFGTNVTLEQVIYQGTSLTWSLNGFMEWGSFSNDFFEQEKVMSAGLGVRMYIKKVNIPALGFDSAYNTSEKKWYFSGSAGVSF